MAAPPTYRLLPHFDCKPSSPIWLGMILLESPKTKVADPDNPVPEVAVAPPDTETPDIQEYNPDADSEAKGWHYADRISSGGGGGFSAETAGLSILSGSLGLDKSKERSIEVSCTKLETTWTTAADRPGSTFKQEIMQKAWNNVFVQSYLKKHWRPWLYLVTGIKVAENATISYSWGKKLDVKGDISVDGSAAAVPVKLGPHAHFNREQTGSQSEFRKGPFILAYRLIRLRPKANGSFVETGDRKRGNFLYGQEDLDDEPSPANEDFWEVVEVVPSESMNIAE